jgi:hypothetical protein
VLLAPPKSDRDALETPRSKRPKLGELSIEASGFLQRLILQLSACQEAAADTGCARASHTTCIGEGLSVRL